MSEEFIDKVCRAIATCRVEGEGRSIAARAIADTIGVAAAGFLEPVATKVETLFAGAAQPNWSRHTERRPPERSFDQRDRWACARFRRSLCRSLGSSERSHFAGFAVGWLGD